MELTAPTGEEEGEAYDLGQEIEAGEEMKEGIDRPQPVELEGLAAQPQTGGRTEHSSFENTKHVFLLQIK